MTQGESLTDEQYVVLQEDTFGRTVNMRDQAQIEQYLKNCRNCAATFSIEEEDILLLEKLSPIFGGTRVALPVPTLCPECRQQRRWATRNQNVLYHRICDSSGRKMISLYSPDKQVRVFHDTEWWSGNWNPRTYGRAYESSQSFFSQFAKLAQVVPKRSMQRDATAENSQYTTYGMNNSDCYMAFGVVACQSVLYSTWLVRCRDTMDSLFCSDSELLYDCVDCAHCYLSVACRDCSQCRDSVLLRDCANCANCICCSNLRNKQFHIYNKPVSPDEYQRTRDRLLAGALAAEKEIFSDWVASRGFRALHLTSCENSTGDYLAQTKDCYKCFDVSFETEGCRYCRLGGINSRDLMDCCAVAKDSELVYESHAVGSSYRCAFCSMCRSSNDCYYCQNISSCSNCFGCVGLRQAEYCVLNRQYSKEEYYTLVQQIVIAMSEAGEWGEFFPMQQSVFGYNETLAQEFFPLSRGDALAKGLQWTESDNGEPVPATVILPATIENTPDSIVNEVFVCNGCKRNYRITSQELLLHRKLDVCIPQICSFCRHAARMNLRHNATLSQVRCVACAAAIETTMRDNERARVLCEECWEEATL